MYHWIQCKKYESWVSILRYFSRLPLRQSCVGKSLLMWSPSSMTQSPDFSFHCVALATLCRISFIWVSGKMDFATELLANLFRFALKNCSLGELPCQARPSSPFCQLDCTFCSSVTFYFAPFITEDQSSGFIQYNEILRPKGSGRGKLKKGWLFNLQQNFWHFCLEWQKFSSVRDQESGVEMRAMKQIFSQVQVTGLAYQVPQCRYSSYFLNMCASCQDLDRIFLVKADNLQTVPQKWELLTGNFCCSTALIYWVTWAFFTG